MKWFPGTCAALCALAGAFAQSPYEKWLNEDVAYLITPEESSRWRRPATGEEREQFIRQFWLRRDPTPDTPENEFKEEHYRRLAYANARFRASAPGWRADRGRVYIVQGPPDEIESHPSHIGDTPPYEVWRYRDGRVLLFVDAAAAGEHRLTADPSDSAAFQPARQLARTDWVAARVEYGAVSLAGRNVRLTFDFEATPAKVHMRITDATRRVGAIFEATSAALPAVSRTLKLAPGAYRLEFTAEWPDGEPKKTEWPLEVPAP